jgi:glycosyltransferase involved in cell wall biosynthesis
MAVAKPVIASRIGGIVELVRDGENGYLMEPDDYKTLADRVIRILGDKNHGQEMGQAGYQLIQESFTIKKHIERIQQLYLSMIGS